MNQRLRELRHALGLSGEKFGEKIGLKRSSVSQIETGTNNLTEANILAICREYNVSEEWLRTGNGQMFSETKESFLVDLQKKHSLTNQELDIARNFLEFSASERKTLIKLTKELLLGKNKDTEIK